MNWIQKEELKLESGDMDDVFIARHEEGYADEILNKMKNIDDNVYWIDVENYSEYGLKTIKDILKSHPNVYILTGFQIDTIKELKEFADFIKTNKTLKKLAIITEIDYDQIEKILFPALQSSSTKKFLIMDSGSDVTFDLDNIRSKVIDASIAFKDLPPIEAGEMRQKLHPYALEHIVNHAYNTEGTLGLYETINIIKSILLPQKTDQSGHKKRRT